MFWAVLNWLVRVKWRALLNYNKFSDPIEARYFLQNLSVYKIFKNTGSNLDTIKEQQVVIQI